ncbi:hypothetical protein [Frondihabitans australicus]|uniref:Uncharacterized protein n=1 Tax=Frondihabitans australicus TaxID=386892 RepID=A0A495IFQ8_9MICO|nr:hypothetical protein [Frondihabitans australicus]RKR74837.1 hypothetical protein C8E83_1968 [Frondihabitans australicus]
MSVINPRSIRAGSSAQEAERRHHLITIGISGAAAVACLLTAVAAAAGVLQ